jgi:site-specific recombinase XerD
MNKQEIIDRFNKHLVIEDYSKQTIKSYSSALKLFLNFVEILNLDKIIEKEIQDYLYYCKKKKNYSFSAMKLETTQIYTHVLSYSINKFKSPADDLIIE